MRGAGSSMFRPPCCVKQVHMAKEIARLRGVAMHSANARFAFTLPPAYRIDW